MWISHTQNRSYLQVMHVHSIQVHGPLDSLHFAVPKQGMKISAKIYRERSNKVQPVWVRCGKKPNRIVENKWCFAIRKYVHLCTAYTHLHILFSPFHMFCCHPMHSHIYTFAHVSYWWMWQIYVFNTSSQARTYASIAKHCDIAANINLYTETNQFERFQFWIINIHDV